MYVKKNILDLYISIFSIGILLCIGCIVATNIIVQEKDVTTIAEREKILLDGKTYMLDNTTNYVNIDTLYNTGYTRQNISSDCDKKNSTIEFNNKNFIIKLICDNRIETLTISN